MQIGDIITEHYTLVCSLRILMPMPPANIKNFLRYKIVTSLYINLLHDCESC